MKYDEILEEVGQFGPYQQKVYFALMLPNALVAMVVMSSVFVATEPGHRCAIPSYPNDTYRVQSRYHEALINLTIPPDDNNDIDGYSQCSTYKIIDTAEASRDDLFTLNMTGRDEVSCDRWVYDKAFDSSIITEFDLVCDKTVMRANLNMGMFAGALVGCFGFGILADVIGRKKALQLTLVLQLFTGVAMFFLPDIISVIIVRCVQGAATQMFGIATATGMELVGPARRTIAGMLAEFAWSAGEYIVLLVAYLAREWRIMELIFGIMVIPILVLLYFTPESPRWLLYKGRYEEAEKIIQKIAASNKETIPVGAIGKDTTDEGPQLRFTEMFKYKKLVIRTLIVFFNWFAVNFLYYGLGLNLDNLSGDIYLNFLYSTVVETAAYILCFFLLDITGRKRLHTFCMLTGGFACVAVIFPVVFGNKDHEWIITALAMIGKMMASCCYATLYIMTVEQFPTVVRNSGLAFCSIFENVSAMTSPYIADLGKLVGGNLTRALPMLVFGAVSLTAGALSTQLPETLGKPLPETIEDAVHFEKLEKVASKEEKTDFISEKVETTKM